jgi:ubiquinone biosynthesis protein UbiJ
VGDVAAHQLGNLARGVAGWGRASAEALARDAGEYLQEERRWLPHRRPVQGWMAEVDRLRGDLDRLEARVERLRRRLDRGAAGGAA